MTQIVVLVNTWKQYRYNCYLHKCNVDVVWMLKMFVKMAFDKRTLAA